MSVIFKKKIFFIRGNTDFPVLQFLLNNNEGAEILTVPFKVQLVQSFNFMLSSISFPISVQMTENVDMALLTLGWTFTCRLDN